MPKRIILEVPPTLYAALRAQLEAAELDARQTNQELGEHLKMDFITLRSKGGPTDTDISVSTLVSSQTQEGKIDFAMNGDITQMDLPKAREVVGMLQAAIEAAISDSLLFRFLTEKVGLSHEAAGAALVDFREMRQGSRDIVHPH